MVPFSFHDEEAHLVDGRALFWARHEALLVADMHLGKASWYAKGGQMLPPYDSRETLERLAKAIRRTGARRVYALGDNFHDDYALDRLDPHARGMLDALTSALSWTWITGNHDSKLQSARIGRFEEEVRLSGVVLRHRASAGESLPEISGHYHPRLALTARGRRISRPCAVHAERKGGAPRLILPAYGALTGGMYAQDPEIITALQPADRIDALVPLTERMLHYPLWKAPA